MEQGNGSALVKHVEVTLAPVTTQRAIILREALREDTEQRALLSQYVQKHMVKDTDYGVIPGTPKPTLYKPGAEKLVDLFRCTPKFVLLTREEDFDKGFFNYMFRVRLVSRDSGAVLAEGFGSGNSREGRYRWRDAQRRCPKCGKATIFRSKNDAEGWFCWKKKEGCGATFAKGDASVEKQAAGKVENDDIATLANTILKMAKKRALVDGAIALARISDVFTQDIEDLADPTHAEEPPRQAAPSQEPPPAQSSEATGRKSAQTASAKESKPTPIAPEPPAEDKARRARADRIWRAFKATGGSKEAFADFLGKVLGAQKPSTTWTDDDMGHIEAAMAAEAQMAREQTP